MKNMKKTFFRTGVLVAASLCMGLAEGQAQNYDESKVPSYVLPAVLT